MIDLVPLNCFASVANFLSQDDKVSLTLVSRSLYHRTVPHLYQRLFLNRRPYFPSDLDSSLGVNRWSVLYVPRVESREQETIEADRSFRFLVRSLQSNVRLCHYIRSVYCSWHIDTSALTEFISLLAEHGHILQFFENFLELDIMKEVSGLGYRLKSLDVSPPNKLPEFQAGPGYYEFVSGLMKRYDWSKISVLTLHVNASTFLRKVSEPLRIASLTLNLRPDTYDRSLIALERPLYEIFDVEALKELRIVSWYKAVDVNVYDLWRLYDFHKFSDIKSLTLLSLNANHEYLRKCARQFTKLERLQVDNLCDTPLDFSTLNSFRHAQCSQSLKYIDIDFELLDPPLLSIHGSEDEGERFLLNLTCRCNDCRVTFENIIVRKYFPTQDKLRIKGMLDVDARNFIAHMFTVFPILPHTDFIDEFPAIGYICFTPEEHAVRVNELLRYSPFDERAITTQDVLRLYHAHIHSLKKTFDHFNSSFPKLEFLTLNDLPTQVMRLDDQQTLNMPLFHSQNYTSNQRYMIVNDESLFD